MSQAEDTETVIFAPVPLWVMDFSELRLAFDGLRAQGVADLRGWSRENAGVLRERLKSCRLVKANAHAEALFEVGSLPLPKDSDVAGTLWFLRQLEALWRGQSQFSGRTVLQARDGKRLTVAFEARILPSRAQDWSRVVIAAVQVSEAALSAPLIFDDVHARGFFEQSPVSLWVEDYSALKAMFEALRRRGVLDLRSYIERCPGFVEEALNAIRIIDVNQRTLTLFAAPDKATLMGGLDKILVPEMRDPFIDELIDLWHGNLTQQREVVNAALNGERLDLVLQLSIMPGYEQNWACVLVGLTDITARKRAEESLEFLASHDVLTKLHNRSFFDQEIKRLNSSGPFPVSAMMADLNGLKPVNDAWGHEAGDALIARVGNVLHEALGVPACAARIGGDEFGVLLPGTDEEAGLRAKRRIERLIQQQNDAPGFATLSLSIGVATCQNPGELESAIRAADRLMYEAKRKYYAAAEMDRRTPV